ncbi:transcriptional regulator TrmB [Fictibacillus macauensis ZFHKF-1]|uniref:Transcriptional regulator TrmB n=1 Tax=Fictibacillus macauensis ZFHKF-1 TaxID=1196324 RepID=I8J5G8_9BACL|nr:helix-turn-helix domain-containing protein [Fictibacillus macauensis]EIT87036.1 transcriptional regulator TrmB [Fictibacillus macauensis ZFHKF-1]
MELLETLQTFGLTQYEAKAYKALVESGTTSAYQISKLSGIPRGRIYDILQGLDEKGIVMVEETEDGTKQYSPLPVEVFLERQKKQWEKSYEHASSQLKLLEQQQPEADDYISTIKGRTGILSYCRTLINNAEKQIVLSMWNPIYTELLPDLLNRKQNGCHIQGIVFDVDNPIDSVYSHRKNEYMSELSNNRWFILSVDNRELLYGHDQDHNPKAFYTNDSVHLFLLEDYIWHDVLVNRLIETGNQQQLDHWILPEMERFFHKKMLPEVFWEKRNMSGRKE